MCFFNTPLYVEKHPDEDLPDYPDCPCCVLDIYEQDAFSLDGQRFPMLLLARAHRQRPCSVTTPWTPLPLRK
ncbi:expressed unknown protein [Ectocarpus siliculosus]|uniref:Uncharacterized protein n=1 Tax=Ectocarpus siliculosus TaxID=2880 RepID=D8LE45_ECTSI|nr:expressed unknown protein [Ectocarpus siliculosus]|eukprot:CBN78562.1 expressed unknown protein [Ectocarpus siliculosus]